MDCHFNAFNPMAVQQLQKPFEGLSCHQQNKTARKDDNTGWLRFEMDGVTEHKGHPKQNKKQQPPPVPAQAPTQAQAQAIGHDEDLQLAALAREVSELRAEVKILFGRLLRSERM